MPAEASPPIISEPVQKPEEQVSHYITTEPRGIPLEFDSQPAKIIEEVMSDKPFLEKLADKDGDLIASVANNAGHIPGAEMYLNHEFHDGGAIEPKKELSVSSVKRDFVSNRKDMPDILRKSLINRDLLTSLKKESAKTSVKRDILDHNRLKILTNRHYFNKRQNSSKSHRLH